ncbi:MAG: phosphatidate cytidylyltransferase [Benjaminiella poitrasii]|nr:MAG: phosphatidate cytidylyltransferase [Benjaminiella poitrasii]
MLFGLFTILMLNTIWYSNKVILLCFTLYNEWFMLWVLLILNKNTTELPSFLLHSFWIHVAILYTLIQPFIIHLNVSNGGMFWFVFPCSLVICNDTAAYLCGKYLVQIKQLKAICALFITILFGHYFSKFLYQFDSLTEYRDIELYQNFHGHAIAIAVYSSIAAPFGGFFASALKRASGIKDFGNLIPGHGGITDRLDCQLFMALFAYVYYNFVAH